MKTAHLLAVEYIIVMGSHSHTLQVILMNTEAAMAQVSIVKVNYIPGDGFLGTPKKSLTNCGTRLIRKNGGPMKGDVDEAVPARNC